MDNQTDALSSFNFDKVSKAGLFLKWQAGKALTLRILTTDPIISESTFEDKQTGEISVNTKVSFIVYNFTDDCAQILGATPAMARKIGDLHRDQDFGSDIRKLDIKITPTGEKLERRYDIQVLPQARTLTNEQIKQAAGIKLEDAIENGTRMSEFDPDKQKSPAVEPQAPAPEDVPVVEEEPEIDLNDIPF